MGTKTSNYSTIPNDKQRGTNSTRDGVLKSMKTYLTLTGQHLSFNNSENASESTKRRVLYGLFKFVVAAYAGFYLAYTQYVFNSSFNFGYYVIYYPITVVENAMWEVRWLVTCWLGILLSRGIWLQTFENSIKHVHLDEKGWRKVRCFSWFLGGALISMWLASEFQILMEIDFRLTRFSVLWFCLDAFLSLVDRVLAFPLFYLFCVTVWLLCLMLESFRQDIVKWEEPKSKKRTVSDPGPSTEAYHSKKNVDISKDNHSNKDSCDSRENSARQRFRELKAAIRTTGLSFELYLMFHFLFLICTFFLGVCASFEQMEVEIAENYSIPLPLQIPQYTRFVHLLRNRTAYHELTTADPGTRSAIPLTAGYPYFTRGKGGKEAVSGSNSTAEQRFLTQTKLVKSSMKTVAISSIIKTLESLLLYFVPIGLMVRLQNRLRQVYEVIEDSNIEEQKNKGFLFDNMETIRRMCKYVKTAHGLRIFGYTVPTFETFMLAAFGPFIAVVTKTLLLHIHMKP